MMLGFCATHDQLAAQEFFVVQFRDGPPRFFDRLHLDESEALRALVVFVAHDLGVLHLTDAVEKLEQIALRGIEREVANIKPGRGHLDRLGLARTAVLRRAVARLDCSVTRLRGGSRSRGCVVASKEACDFLPEALFGGSSRLRAIGARIEPPAGSASARTPRASPGGLRFHNNPRFLPS